MRDKVRFLWITMQLLALCSFALGIYSFVFAIGDHEWLTFVVFGVVGVGSGYFYAYVAECLKRFRREGLVRVAFAYSLLLSSTLILAPLALPLAVVGMMFMRAYDVDWTFAQVAKGVPLAEVLATTPPRERFGDERDDYDDDRRND